MLRETGCDGVMVGRAAISNPWALARVSAAVAGIEPPPDPTMEERIAVALEHLRLAIAYQADVDSYEEALDLPPTRLHEAETHAVRSLRGQIPLYIKGEPGAAQAREHLTRCSSLHEMEAELEAFRRRADLVTA
jgi:tRNA-dihydrouridine synthase B